MENKVTPGSGERLHKGRGKARHFLAGPCVLGGLKEDARGSGERRC